MKKIVSFLLILCLFIPLCFVSCAKKEVEGVSGESSNISYVEASSGIAKTENDGSFTFAFDPYVLPRDVKQALGGTSLYKRFVDAVLEHQKTVSMPSRDDYDNIRFAIGENFPFAALISDYRYDLANSQIMISYEYEQTHDEKIQAFKAAVQQVFDACVENNDDDVIAAISLYAWLAQNIEIENETPVYTDVSSNIASSEIASSEGSPFETEDEATDTATDIYHTLIEKKGTAASVSALYSFLLMQLGIECKTVSSWNTQNYKTWNMIQINSKWYHCDIYSEQKETEGTGLRFFGMTRERVLQYIDGNGIYSGEWSWFTSDIPKANSARFEDFSRIVSWEMNQNRDGIVAFTDEYSRFTWGIND